MVEQPAIALEDLAHAVGGRLVGSGRTTVAGVAGLAEAGPNDLTFITSDRHLKAALASRAAAFVVAREVPQLARPQIVVPNPAYAFAKIVERFFTAAYKPRGIGQPIARGREVLIGPDVSIWPFVTLGDRVHIGARVTLYPGVFVGDDAEIGDDSILYPNVTVGERCRLGARVIVHSGTVIGSDGFGYVQHEGRHQKIPQLGTVVIEDDVELGANVAVDRATFGCTTIKRGTKVDNLVQIAHNVTIGEHSILVAQVGIAGSTTVGHHVMVGGQAGIADHIQVGDQVMIAARTGVNRNLSSNQMVAGAPVMSGEVALKAHAVIPLLPELRRHLRDLEQRVRTLEQGGTPQAKSEKKLKPKRAK